MKHILILILALVGNIYSQNIQPVLPNTYIQDYARILNVQDKNIIQQKLYDIKLKYNIDISIVTVKTTKPYSIYDYSLKMAMTYGVGSKGSDKKSLLILFATDDKTSFMQVSKGMETILTDAQAKVISRDLLPKYFQAANRTNNSLDWMAGFITTIKNIDDIALSKIKPERKEMSSSNESDDTGILGVICIFAFLTAVAIALKVHNSIKKEEQEDNTPPWRRAVNAAKQSTPVPSSKLVIFKRNKPVKTPEEEALDREDSIITTAIIAAELSAVDAPIVKPDTESSPNTE